MFYRYEFRKAFLAKIPQHKGKDKVKYVCVLFYLFQTNFQL